MSQFINDWLPLLLVGGGIALFITLHNPFILAIVLTFSVALSPELPLGLPLRIGDFVLVGTIVVVMLQLRQQSKHQRNRNTRSRTATASAWPPEIPNLYPWLWLLGIELLATLIGVLQGTTTFDLSGVYDGAVFLAKSTQMFILYVVIIYLLDTPQKIRTYVWGVLVAGAALAGYGTYMMLTGQSDVPGVVVDIEGGPTYSLIALALAPPLLLGTAMVLIYNEVWWKRFVIAGLLAIIGYAFLYTLSRQAYVGVGVAVAIMLFVYDRWLFFRLVPVILIVLFFFPTLIPEAVLNRTQLLVDPLTGDIAESTVYDTRLNVWRYRLPIFLQTNPLTGMGLASLPPGSLDSQYAIALYYTGIIGFIIFLRLLFAFGHLTWQTYLAAPTPCEKALCLAGLGAVISFGVSGLGGAPFVAVRAREMFWLLMAGVAAYSLHMQQRVDSAAQSHAPA